MKKKLLLLFVFLVLCRILGEVVRKYETDIANNKFIQMVFPYLEFFVSRLLFLIIGVISLICSIVLLFKTKRNTSNHEIAYGTIIDVEEVDDNDGVSYCPVIEYEDKNDRSKRVFRVNGSSKKYKIGDSTELRICRKGEKEEIYLNSWFYIYVGPIFLLIFSLIFCVIGYSAYIGVLTN